MAERVVEGQTPAPTQVPRQPLSRDRILRAAVRVMDAEGVEAVTMRRLGRELGVEAMSLYNHVRDKEDILIGIIESVMTEFALPGGEGDWLARVRTMAAEFRRLLLAHPNVVQLIAEHHGPPTSPNGFLPVEVALSTLRAGGLSPEETVHAYRALVGYVMGYVAQSDNDSEFEFGLDMLLEGLRTRLSAGR